MPIKASGNYTLSYNAVALAGYIDDASLEAVANAIEVNNLASTATVSIPTDTTVTVQVGGAWDKAVDDALAPDSLSPPTTLRTWSMVIGASGAQVTYGQTGTASVGAFVSNYKAQFTATEAAKWTATMSIAGTVTRS